MTDAPEPPNEAMLKLLAPVLQAMADRPAQQACRDITVLVFTALARDAMARLTKGGQPLHARALKRVVDAQLKYHCAMLTHFGEPVMDNIIATFSRRPPDH